MEEIFRFLMLRPAELKRAREDAIVLRPSSSLWNDVEAALRKRPAASAVRSVAVAHLKTDPVERVRDLPHGDQIEEYVRRLDLSAEDTADAVNQAAKSAFGDASPPLAGKSELAMCKTRLADTLLCRKYSGQGGHDLWSLERAYKALALLEVGARPPRDFSLRAFLARVLVPADALLQWPSPPDLRGTPPGRGRDAEDWRAREKRIAELRAAQGEVRNALEELLSAALRDEDAEIGASAPAPAPRTTSRRPSRGKAAPKPSASPPGPETVSSRLLLSREGILSLSKDTTALLARENIQLAIHALPDATTKLLRRMRAVANELCALSRAAAGDRRVLRIGSGFYEVQKAPWVFGGTPRPEGVSVPTSHGALQPVGIADLLVVRQSLKRYEARELSHIENVLSGEHKSREHTRSRSTEETTTVETETTREEERDQQTTERSELQREAQAILTESFALQAGGSLSGSYGPCVEFTTTAEFGMSKSKEEASRQASTYSKETTQRAASKVTERVRREVSLKVTETFQESSVHEIDNRGNAEAGVGMYQWVEKVYEAQVWNYGQRMMFDFVVPEPAAFLLHALTSRPPASADLEPPIPFELRADEIDEVDYFLYAQRYDVQGVEPPPAPFVEVVRTFDGADDRSDRGEMTKVAELPIPEGYATHSATVTATFTKWQDGASVTVTVGPKWHVFQDTKESSIVWKIKLAGHEGLVPACLKTLWVEVFAASFDIHCVRTARALDAWKLKTHGLIKLAYLEQVKVYEEKLAAAKAEAASEPQGTSPTDNRRIERTELKRLAISVFTAQHFDSFGAVEAGGFGYPQIDFAEADAEGRYIRFFEQAFEWEQMMYVFYPYFWGAKEGWRASVLRKDDDAQFGEFLRAGAARVVLPVRPGFELSITHFLETGQIWQGGDPPLITSPMYLSIVDEIKERTGSPGTEVPYGEPWEVRVPTTLVAVRGKPGLPSWSKSADGAWVEDP